MGKKILIVLSLIFVYGLYYWGVPAVVNSQKNLLEEKIFEKTGYRVSIINPLLKTGKMPSVKIFCDYAAVLNDDGTKALEVTKPYININLFPLLLKKVDIKGFYAENLTVNLVYDRDGKLKLGQYPILKSENSVNRAKGNISAYNINLDDKIRKEKINVKGKYFKVQDFNVNKRILFSTEAESGNSAIKADMDIKLPLKKISGGKLKINGYFKNLNLSDFSAYANSFSDNRITNLSGTVNAQVMTSDDEKITGILEIDNLNIADKNDKLSIKSDGKLNITSDIQIIENGININDLKVKGKGIDALISGEVTDIDAKIPTIDLKTVIKNSKAENIVSLLPPSKDLSPDIDFEVLKKAGFWGDVNSELLIKGKADYPNVYGNVDITNAYMVKPIANAKKADIKLDFVGEKFNIDTVVPTSPTETVWVKGFINLDKERSADLDIKSTENNDLKTAQIVLNPLHEALRFDLGPVPIMDIKGKGGINLHIIGTKKNPFGWGQFRFKNVTASFNDIHNMIMTNGSGTLDFKDQDSLFQTKTANLNGKPVSIKGTCTLLGDMDFDVTAKGQDLSKLIRIIKTSPMLEDIQKLLTPVETATGISDLELKLTGQIKDINNLVFNKNIFAKGSIKLISDMIKIKDLPAVNTSGTINFENLDTNFNLISRLNSSNINITGKIKDDICNLKLVSERLNLGDALKTLMPKNPYAKEFSAINTSFNASYSGKVDEINYNKIVLRGKIHSNQNMRNSIVINNGTFELANSNFKLSPISGLYKGSPYNISLNVSNMFSDKRVVNGSFKISSFDLNTLKTLAGLLPADTAKILRNTEFLNSKVNLNAYVINNRLNGYSNLENISFVYKPENLKITINNGNLSVKNNTLNIGKINAKIGNTPIFIDGKISNVQTDPNLNIYLNSRLSQEFFDQFFNQDSVYPIKLKGDAFLTSKLKGSLDNLNSFSTLNINEDSSIYYMGASVGETENPVKITINNVFMPNKIKVNNFQYDKIIKSQNNKPIVNTQLNASGTLNLNKNGISGFNNFKIKTKAPTDAKIFNIIFRKPFMKQGVFTSDLTLNGSCANPIINGILNITSIDIPFFDSTVNDVNLAFKNGKIIINTKGTVLTNDIYLNAVLKNKLTPPYIAENVKLKLVDLDINKIADTIRDIEAESVQNPTYTHTNNSEQFDITQFVIQKAEIEADKIKVRNINANNFKSTLSLNDKKQLNIDKFKFDIAEGSVLGSLKYNLANKRADLDIHLNNANALIMSEALFDLKGQVYGSVNGDFNLACTGNSNDDCFKTLSGSGTFKIADGRIPKLGSLEYLLKAGNLFKGGLTGLSINSIIDLITPLKTGNFEKISGDMSLSEGIADKINIYSSGNDLNMYMSGSYNITTSVADMKIYGSLSKNITTVFGKIKNASLNTLFNTIPGVSNNTEKLLMQEGISKIPNLKDATDIYRIFAVDINGDINGDNYVRSFEWVK